MLFEKYMMRVLILVWHWLFLKNLTFLTSSLDCFPLCIVTLFRGLI